MDPRGGQVVFFDHMSQQVTGSRPLSGNITFWIPSSTLTDVYILVEDTDRDVEPYRKAFEVAVQHYMDEHYVYGTATVYGNKTQNRIELTVCISSSKFSPTNYWNGRWRSKWHCDFTLGTSKVDLEGLLKVSICSFLHSLLLKFFAINQRWMCIILKMGMCN